MMTTFEKKLRPSFEKWQTFSVKIPQFSQPPLFRLFGVFEFAKNCKFDDAPATLENKHKQKLSKNHLKHLFAQLKHLKPSLTIEKTLKIQTSLPSSQKIHILNVSLFLFVALTLPPYGIFPLFVIIFKGFSNIKVSFLSLNICMHKQNID